MVATRVRAALLMAASVAALAATGAAAQTPASPTRTRETPPPTSPSTSEQSRHPNGDEANGALAQAENNIVVTGTRFSLENAEQLKRNSDVLVDAISADDIGALPDSSIAESLVRIPGVTINDRQGNFEQASLRGLGPDLTVITYNGRIYPAISPDDRRINLSDVPSEGIAAAIIQKTSDAATIEGGLSGIIGLRSVRPLETSQRGLTISARGIYDSIANQVDGPYGYPPYGFRGEIAYIVRPADNLGISINYSYMAQPSVSPSVRLDQPRIGLGARRDPNGDGVADAYPVNVGPQILAENQHRHAALGMVQWDPVRSLRVTADVLYTHDSTWYNAQRFFATGTNANLAAPTSFTVANNTVTSFDGQVLLYREILHDDHVTPQQFAAGLNLAFDDRGPLNINVDMSYARAWTSGQNRQITTENDAANATAQRINVAYDIRDRAHPTFTFQPLAAEDYALSDILITNVDLSDTIKAFRADFALDLGLPFLHDLTFGFRIDNRFKRKNPDNIQWSWPNVATRPDLDSSFLNVPTSPFVNVARFLGGSSGAGFPLFDVDRTLDLTTAAGVVLNNQTANDIAARSTVSETTYAGYVQANIEAGRLTGNVGVRYFVTDETIRGFVGTTEANKVPQVASHSYSYALPALNLRYALTESLFARLALYKTASRPLFGNLRIGSPIDLNSLGQNPTISRGNPDLRPFTANNADASLEWYPNRATFVAIQGYYKAATNFIVNASVPGTITLPNGTVVPATINTSVNDPNTVHFKGIELIARRDLDFLPGFLRNTGIQADYSRNWTDARATIAGVDGTATPVLPNNFIEQIFNAQLYYSTRTVDIRVAYRRYSHYLRLADNAYQIRPAGTLDLSGSVEVLPNVRLTAIIANITNAVTYEYIPDYRDPSNQLILRNALWDGRNITLGVRAHF